MISKSNVVVGLDIGTTIITVVIAYVDGPHLDRQGAGGEGEVEIVGVGTSPSRGLRKGVVINIEATVQSIAKAISQAETMAGVEVHSVFAAISGSHIKGLNSHGIVGVKNKEVSPYDMEKVIEAAKAVAIPLDREILHVLPQEYIIDEQDGIREPLGISGVRLEARVHMITGAVASAQNIVKCANRCGLEVEDIVLAALASGRAVLAPEEMELGVCLIDIGGGTADMTVYTGGAVRHSAVISVGGGHITNDIAAGLRTPLLSAEEIKCVYGTALLSSVTKDDTIEVPSTGGRAPRVLSKLILSEIIEPRVVEILTLIQRELVRSGCDELLTSGLVLTGGTGNLDGIAQVAEQVFNLPVRVGAPSGVGGLVDLVRGPEFSTAVGLVQYGAATRQVRRDYTSRGRFSRMFKKVGNWFGEYF